MLSMVFIHGFCRDCHQVVLDQVDIGILDSCWDPLREVVLAVEVPAGLIDGALCLVWLKAWMVFHGNMMAGYSYGMLCIEK